VEVWQTSNLRWLRLGEERKKEERRRRKNKRQDENIMVCPIPDGDHNDIILEMLKYTINGK